MDAFENTAIRGAETVDRLSEIPGVLAIFLGGSWSTGHGDRYGDIDIGILNDSGCLEESYVRVVEDLAKDNKESLRVNPWEATFLDCDQRLLHVRCAGRSENEARSATSNPCSAAT